MVRKAAAALSALTAIAATVASAPPASASTFEWREGNRITRDAFFDLVLTGVVEQCVNKTDASLNMIYKACFDADGDKLYILDDRQDSYAGAVRWKLDNGSDRRGACTNHYGNGYAAVCNYDFPEQAWIHFEAGYLVTHPDTVDGLRTSGDCWWSVSTGAMAFPCTVL